MFSWMINQNITEEWNMNAIIIPPHKFEEFESHGNKLKIIVPTSLSNNQFGIYEIEMEPGARGPKLHYHKEMSETFIVTEGTVTVITANGESEAKTGTLIHIPKFAAHAYNNDSDEKVKMTLIFTPGQNREGFFRKLYKMLDENPNELVAFHKLYLENDSYPLDESDMIPLQTKN